MQGRNPMRVPKAVRMDVVCHSKKSPHIFAATRLACRERHR
jgi:hypothetical protein